MKEEQGLKTLRDYRKAARDSLYDLGIIPKNKNTSFYDAIKTALINIKDIIICSRSQVAIDSVWSAIILPNSEYAHRNMQLFDSVKLMEFAITYQEVRAIDTLAQNWPKRPDVNAMVFTSAGISFLEASFNFVFKTGCNIILILQNAYKKYNKEGNIIYRDPFRFLNKTPSVDDLNINPKPDIIIKTWFDNIIEGAQSGFPKNEFSYNEIIARFNSVLKQLEYEWNVWNSGKVGGKENEPRLTDIKSRFKTEESRIFFDSVDLDLPTGKIIEIAKILIENFGNVVGYPLLDSESSEKEASDNLRKYKSSFGQALKKFSVPCHIKTKKKAGYILLAK